MLRVVSFRWKNLPKAVEGKVDSKIRKDVWEIDERKEKEVSATNRAERLGRNFVLIVVVDLIFRYSPKKI